MDEEMKKAYSEVVEILKLIEDEKKIEKLPFEVIELIKRNSDQTYKPQISREIPLEEQSLRKETYSIMAWIASKYWEEEICLIEQKNLLKDIKVENIEEQEEQEEIKETIVYNDIKPEALGEEIEEESNAFPVVLTEESWFEKIKIHVIRIFKFLFGLNKKENQEGVNE